MPEPFSPRIATLSFFNILSLLIFFPAFAAIIGLLVKPEAIKVYGITVAVVEFLASLALWGGFDVNNGGMQFIEMVPLISDFGINYYLGVDGISLFIVIMATLMTLIGMISLSVTENIKI